jgi:hypothetical protein
MTRANADLEGVFRRLSIAQGRAFLHKTIREEDTRHRERPAQWEKIDAANSRGRLTVPSTVLTMRFLVVPKLRWFILQNRKSLTCSWMGYTDSNRASSE